MSVARQLTVAWEDPAKTANAAGRISGMEFLAKLLDGTLPPPPVINLVGINLDSFSAGKAAMTLVVGEQHYNPLGMVHGGIVATLLDSVMGLSVHTQLPTGRAYTTLEIKVNYLRPVTAQTGTIRAEGTAIHVGRKSAVAEARVIDAGGKLYATASTTCLVFEIAEFQPRP